MAAAVGQASFMTIQKAQGQPHGRCEQLQRHCQPIQAQTHTTPACQGEPGCRRPGRHLWVGEDVHPARFEGALSAHGLHDAAGAPAANQLKEGAGVGASHAQPTGEPRPRCTRESVLADSAQHGRGLLNWLNRQTARRIGTPANDSVHAISGLGCPPCQGAPPAPHLLVWKEI